MSSLDIAVYPAITFPIFFALGNNLASYNNAKKWLDCRGIDYSYYEDRKKLRKGDSLIDLMNYYLGWPRRHLVYKLYSKKSGG